MHTKFLFISIFLNPTRILVETTSLSSARFWSCVNNIGMLFYFFFTRAVRTIPWWNKNHNSTQIELILADIFIEFLNCTSFFCLLYTTVLIREHTINLVTLSWMKWTLSPFIFYLFTFHLIFTIFLTTAFPLYSNL